MISIKTVIEVTGLTSANIITHYKFIEARLHNFGTYKGINTLLNTAEFGEYILFLSDLKRLGTKELALNKLIERRLNVKTQTDIINKAVDNLSQHAPLINKYFDIPLTF